MHRQRRGRGKRWAARHLEVLQVVELRPLVLHARPDVAARRDDGAARLGGEGVQREEGVADDRAVRVRVVPGELEPAWRAVVAVDGLGREYRAIEPRLLVYGALALSAIFLYQVFSWVGLQFLLHDLEQEYLAARQASQPVLEVREATLALQDGNHVIAELGQRSQLDLMAEIVRELPAADKELGALMSWKFQADELTFVINRPTAGLEDYAAALDQIKGLDEIDLLPNDRARQLAINVRMK